MSLEENFIKSIWDPIWSSGVYQSRLTPLNLACREDHPEGRDRQRNGAGLMATPVFSIFPEQHPLAGICSLNFSAGSS